MGWLFACFGCTKKRKRPKKASKFGPKSRKIQSYQLLEESDDPKQLDEPQTLNWSSSGSREKLKGEDKAGIRKRVRFNLEVTTYELLPADDDITNSLDFEGGKNSWGERPEEEGGQPGTKVFLGYAPTSMSKYSPNHRYNNCSDEEDEYHDDEDDNDIEDELSDLSDDDDDEYNSCLIDADKIYHEEITEENHHIISQPLRSSEDRELGTSDGSKLTTRFRSHYVVPVLNPIENLSQWKSIKARKC